MLTLLVGALAALKFPGWMLVDPSRKVTWPAGVPEPLAVIGAVNGTASPGSDGLAEMTAVAMPPATWKNRMPSTWLSCPSSATMR